MQCRAALTRIDALRTRELAPMEQTAVEQHLKTCRSCNESTSDVDSLAHAVKSLAVAPTRSCCDDVKTACVDSYDRVGDVWVAFSKTGVRMVTTGESIDEIRAPYAKRYGRELAPATIPETLRKQVVAAMSGEGVDTPRVDLEPANDLEHDVLQTLSRIPRGQIELAHRGNDHPELDRLEPLALHPAHDHRLVTRVLNFQPQPVDADGQAVFDFFRLR